MVNARALEGSIAQLRNHCSEVLDCNHRNDPEGFDSSENKLARLVGYIQG